MAGTLHPRTGPAVASFELERMEHGDGCVVVSGWWSGVRGMRFVRPALVMDGRQVLATLEHKPWAAAEDGSWTAAFPWKDCSEIDARAVTLAVAPSVQVPLDRDAVDVQSPGYGEVMDVQSIPVAEPRPAVPEDEHLQARIRELEGVAARERRVAHDAERAREEFERTNGLAAADRERALDQLAEAIADREAALRTRARMEAQRDEAIAKRAEAEARRDEVLAQRDEARRQRDEVLLAHRAQQRRLKGQWAQAEREPSAPPAAGVLHPQPVDGPAEPTASLPSPAERRAEQPIGVRMIPAARTVAAHLHRAQRDLGHGLTSYDLWVVRILGTVAAVAFISLLVMILKAFFVF